MFICSYVLIHSFIVGKVSIFVFICSYVLIHSLQVFSKSNKVVQKRHKLVIKVTKSHKLVKKMTKTSEKGGKLL